MDEETPPVVSILGKTGIAFASEDGRHSIHLWFRGQLRYSTPFDTPLLTPEQFERGDVSTFNLRRVRLKLGGNVYRKWLGYYLEYDFKSNALLDLRFTLSPRPWLQLRAGQWKANFNRERVDSSGRQQFAERSIVTRVFTIDRQPGVMVFGRLLADRPADSWYYLGVFNGNGAQRDQRRHIDDVARALPVELSRSRPALLAKRRRVSREAHGIARLYCRRQREPPTRASPPAAAASYPVSRTG